MIVLGGGVIEAMGDDLLDPIRQSAAKYALPTTMDGVQIVEATLGDNAGVIGASVFSTSKVILKRKREKLSIEQGEANAV